MKHNQGRLAKVGKNYGFIRHDGKDVFVHFSNYLKGFTPELNQRVEFEFGPAPDETRPPVAIRIRVIKPAEQVEHEMMAGLNALRDTQGGSHERPTA